MDLLFVYNIIFGLYFKVIFDINPFIVVYYKLEVFFMNKKVLIVLLSSLEVLNLSFGNFATMKTNAMEPKPIETKVTKEDSPFGRNFLPDYSLKDKLTIWFKSLKNKIPIPTRVKSPGDNYEELTDHVREELEKRQKESADENYDESGYNKYGYDKYQFDREGYDYLGFDRNGIHKITKGRFSDLGYDICGYNKNTGVIYQCMAHYIWEPDGTHYNLLGFSTGGYHKDTDTLFDTDGYDQYGFNSHGIHRYTRGLYNEFGFNQRGFTKSGRNVFTGTDLDKSMHDVNGKSHFYANNAYE